MRDQAWMNESLVEDERKAQRIIPAAVSQDCSPASSNQLLVSYVNLF
jgi:hypothetical protein